MNEKRLPTKILVGGRAFTVNVVTDGSIGDDLGQLLFTLGKIQVAPHQVSDCLIDTVFHEVIHAIDFTYGAAGNHLTDEQVVRLTGGLLAVLYEPRNIKLVKFLFQTVLEEAIKRNP